MQQPHHQDPGATSWFTSKTDRWSRVMRVTWQFCLLPALAPAVLTEIDAWPQDWRFIRFCGSSQHDDEVVTGHCVSGVRPSK